MSSDKEVGLDFKKFISIAIIAFGVLIISLFAYMIKNPAWS